MRRSGFVIVNKKKENLPSRKKVKREITAETLLKSLKKLWNMKVTTIPIVIGALGTVTKGLVKGQEDLETRGQVKTIRPSTNAGVKNSHSRNNNYNNNDNLFE